ncbi:MAG TPA: CBS domain-containing protein [Candidatus Limnocylindria bacterium]|nr:CBS domain-containing protein [Candidatus Limnocylindria bacterium]
MSVTEAPLLVPGLYDVFVAAISDDPQPPQRSERHDRPDAPERPGRPPERDDDLRVADLMTIDPITVRVDDTIELAEERLHEYRIHGLPVVDEYGHLVGIVSQTDLLYLAQPTVRALIRRREQGIRVGEVMSVPPVTVDAMATLADAARLMHERRLHRLVVVDAMDRPIGVLSSMDFVALATEA